MTTNLTKGNPLKLIILFSIPIFIGNVFQQLYNIVDTTVIGRNLGDVSLAAIGATAAIFSLIVCLASGTSNGFGVVLSRYYGKNDEKGMKKVVGMIYFLSIIMAIIITLIAVFAMKPFLQLLNTPDEIINDTCKYLQIISAFFIIIMFYNMYASMLRAIGNSLASLYFLAISVVINIVLDIVFVKVAKLGISGVAYATIISFAVATVCCAIYIKKKTPILTITKKDICFDKKLIKELLANGLAMGMMLAIVCIGSIALQQAINGFGTEIIAAHTAARKIDELLMMPFTTFGLAIVTYVSQNYGAGNFKRIKEGVRIVIVIDLIWAALSILITLIFGKMMIIGISGSSNELIINTAHKYLMINVPFFLVLVFLLIMRCTLQGLDRKIIPIVASIVELVFKFIAAQLLTPKLGYFGICIIEPIIWALCGGIVVVGYIVSMKKIKEKEVTMATPKETEDIS